MRHALPARCLSLVRNDFCLLQLICIPNNVMATQRERFSGDPPHAYRSMLDIDPVATWTGRLRVRSVAPLAARYMFKLPVQPRLSTSQVIISRVDKQPPHDRAPRSRLALRDRDAMLPLPARLVR